MELRKIREHFATKNKGKTWYPKKVFKSAQEAIDLGFHEGRWYTYTCSHCNKLHISEIKERKYK